MRQFEKKIKELGLEKGKLSKNLNELVSSFEVAEEDLKGMKQQLKEEQEQDDNEDEINDLIKKIESEESDLNQYDEQLTKKIVVFHKNNDLYVKNAEKMRAAREAKAAAKNENKQVEDKKVEVAPIVEMKPVKTEEVKTKEQITIDELPNETKTEEKPKSKTNWLLWTALGVAGIFLGVKLSQNKK